MKPLEMLYWSRAGLGVAIGVINALYDYFTGVLSRELQNQPSINDFLTGLSFALLFFLITYYILKFFFSNKIEKKTKILSTGIGAYFFLWLVVWVLFRSIMITTL